MHCDYIFFPDHQTRPHKSSYWLISRSFDQPNITQSRAGVRKIFSGKYFLNYSSPPQLRYIPPITLFSQLRYFELGPRKLELRHFFYWLISYSFDQPNITWSRAGFRKMFSGKYFLNYYMIFFFVFSFLLVFDHSINRKCNLVKVLWAMQDFFCTETHKVL